MRHGIGFLAAVATVGQSGSYRPEIPTVWNDRDVAAFELPLAVAERSPRQIDSKTYYGFPVRTIHRGYPIYHPDRVPAGYEDWLREREPEVAFDPGRLGTEADWVAAGALVFRAPLFFVPYDKGPVQPFRDPEYFAKLAIHVTGEGVFPYGEVVIRERGKLEVGLFACAMCHTRILPNGEVLHGAQGDYSFAQTNAYRLEKLGFPKAGAASLPIFYSAPWIRPGEYTRMTAEHRAGLSRNIPPGVFPRQGTSLTHPPRIPSLIGLEGIRYLDNTGLVRHRSIGDLMRYAAMTQGLDILAHYGDFQPSPTMAPFFGPGNVRYSDEQLYALARYVYSLRPPPNPNPVSAQSRRGERLFERARCAECHPAPLYTNNQLTPADGFEIPPGAADADAIYPFSVGTDPTLTMETRRGTGYYKVPSLRGLWYRSVFGHGGQAASLEEWLDPARLEDGYVPRGSHLAPGPIQGHRYGLELSDRDRRALIAFLKTL